MAYSELIKNFNRIREYMRDFYLFGFKSRSEYNNKSARSYDDERRRVEAWLDGYMRFNRTADGKNIFISIDSRISQHNPLYNAWKAKSFTDGDITLHFILFDMLSSSNISLPLCEITSRIDEYLDGFDNPRLFDESTVRKKLKEYVNEGIIIANKCGKTMYYSRSAAFDMPSGDLLDFYSEAAPCGVIGLFLLDKLDNHNGHFAFKHHYITSALDSEIMCALFMAMREKKNVTISSVSRRKGKVFDSGVTPLRIMISVQNGRQYLMAHTPKYNRITSYRLDNIVSVKIDGDCDRFDELRQTLDNMQRNMWGVSTQGVSGQRLEHVDFTVHYDDNEQYIHNRLEREKRCGTVCRIDNNTSRFSADVYDSSELVPWIRTYICRITEIYFSNKELEKQFCGDITNMYNMYGIEGGDGL